MTPLAQHILLLTSTLGDPNRRVLSTAQFRRMAEGEPLENLEEQVAALLQDADRMQSYLDQAIRYGCRPLVASEEEYPSLLNTRLGYDAPGVLWAMGDCSLLERPAVALVGSRDLLPDNLEYARMVGHMAAAQGVVLVSGNARGADREAQDTCLAHGGQVICVVADKLKNQSPAPNILYLSEDSYDLGFSSRRALSRNRIIHCLGSATFVAQSSFGRGGTWDGTMKNLRSRWSAVYCCQDGRQATEEFVFRGAIPITIDDIGRVIYEQSR